MERLARELIRRGLHHFVFGEDRSGLKTIKLYIGKPSGNVDHVDYACTVGEEIFESSNSRLGLNRDLNLTAEPYSFSGGLSVHQVLFDPVYLILAPKTDRGKELLEQLAAKLREEKTLEFTAEQSKRAI